MGYKQERQPSPPLFGEAEAVGATNRTTASERKRQSGGRRRPLLLRRSQTPASRWSWAHVVRQRSSAPLSASGDKH